MNDLLAIRLLELAIKAGWKPGDCVQFARDAHEFVISTLPEMAAQQLVAGAGNIPKKVGPDDAANEAARSGILAEESRDGSPVTSPAVSNSRVNASEVKRRPVGSDHHANGTEPFRKTPSSARPVGSTGVTGGERPTHQPNHPEWGPDSETRRKALQALANQNRTMSEAAEILGVSQSVVASTAFKLKISFHGRLGHRLRPAAPKNTKAAAKVTNGTATHPLINGAAVAKPVDRAVDRRIKRRCPSCNQVFEPAEVSHYLCDDCENGNNAAR